MNGERGERRRGREKERKGDREINKRKDRGKERKC